MSEETDVPETTELTLEEKAAAWEKWVRDGVNSLVDTYLPVSNSCDFNVAYSYKVIEELESGTVLDETKANAVLIRVMFKFTEPISLSKK
jgi:hypothetical protein